MPRADVQVVMKNYIKHVKQLETLVFTKNAKLAAKLSGHIEEAAALCDIKPDTERIKWALACVDAEQPKTTPITTDVLVPLAGEGVSHTVIGKDNKEYNPPIPKAFPVKPGTKIPSDTEVLERIEACIVQIEEWRYQPEKYLPAQKLAGHIEEAHTLMDVPIPANRVAKALSQVTAAKPVPKSVAIGGMDDAPPPVIDDPEDDGEVNVEENKEAVVATPDLENKDPEPKIEE